MLSVSHDQFKSDTGKGRLLYVGKHKHIYYTTRYTGKSIANAFL